MPYVATIDWKCILKLWDIVSLICLQSVVTQDSVPDKLSVQLLCVNKNLLWTYSSHFRSFDNIKHASDHKTLAHKLNKKQSQQPLQAGYNQFHNFVWVQNANQIKLFSLKDGELLTLHPDMFENTRILTCHQDTTHRRLYLQSVSGVLKVINISNGSKLRQDKLVEGSQTSLVDMKLATNPSF